ncbi:putative Extracellular solute-binding protein, family 7 [uncultured delta proteobacterium]|uniref:Putative Extracellular solute-binding protein, family 7 n=1 Tax=uncultured delta proteobacterium TaxID=34034 RepID=A0A212JD31_9DELT|nr:putative Extracellular solute-binding protein, family 7 [uncultured delta proteobacterium]
MIRKASVLLAIAAVLCFTSIASAKTTLTALSVWNKENYQVRGLEMMAKRVAELTKGEVTLRVEFGGSLGYKGAELLKAVGDGQLDMAEMVASNVAGDAPVFGLRTLPMMISDWDEVALFDKMAKPYYDAAAAKINQRVLVISPWPFGGLWANKKVETIGDMKDLKIRSYDRNGALFASAVGAKGLNVPYAEAYTGLATGLIDSVVTSSISVREGKFYEVCKFHMPIRFATATSVTTINENSWKKLTADQQKALETAAAECQAFLWEEVKKVVAANDQFCYENGVTLVPVSEAFHAELVKASESVAADWLEKNKNATDAVELYHKFMEAKKRK